MDKRGAIELSIGTIVIIVLAMTMLILGMVLVRSIMCSGIIISDQISTGVENKVKDLFGASDLGVKCMGEAGEDIKIGDGGKRQIFCVIKTDTSTEYTLTMKSITSLSGVKDSEIAKWVLDKDWTGTVKSGEQTVVPLVLNIPKNVDATSLKIEIEEDTGTGKETHISYIDVVHLGKFATTIC